MSRFYFPDKFFRPQSMGNLIAFFSFVDNETGLEYRDWKLVQGQHGVFVGSPSGQPYTPAGESKPVYPALIKPAYDSKGANNRNAKGEQFLKDLAAAAYAKYEQVSGPGKGASASARGPVAAGAGSGGAVDDLPF